mgnify:CR=1 FL=1
MEYVISKKEIVRRKAAYLALCVSLMIGVFSGSLIFNLSISTLGYTSIAVALFLIGLFSFDFFRKILKIRIEILPQSLRRINGNSTEEYALSKINRVVIKWTANKTIREIYIWLSDGKSIFITALDGFERFKDELIGKLKDASVKEKHELIDFDHPLFYPILGLLTGGISVFLFKMMINLDYQQIRKGAFLFFGYLILFGMYFIIFKPISKRSGNKTHFYDYILGSLFIVIGIALFIINI